MSHETRKVAVVGIDGAGKSSLVERLAGRAAGDALALTSPRFFEMPDAPFGFLSRALDALTRAADALGSFELKGASLYLQMTPFGPVERFFVDTYAPELVVWDRHAVVDTLAYGALYGQLVRRPPDEALRGPLGERLEAELPGATEAIAAWLAVENRRLGEALGLWEVAPHLGALCRRPPAELLPELERRYRTALPDAVVLLDVPGEVAARRLAGRGSAELHEQAAMLEQVRRCYFAALRFLRDAHPEVRTEVIEGSAEAAVLDARLDAVLEACGAQRRPRDGLT